MFTDILAEQIKIIPERIQPRYGNILATCSHLLFPIKIMSCLNGSQIMGTTTQGSQCGH